VLRVWLPSVTVGAIGALVFALSDPEDDEPPEGALRQPILHAAPWFAPPLPSTQPGEYGSGC
jgi:hypothetical protein